VVDKKSLGLLRESTPSLSTSSAREESPSSRCVDLRAVSRTNAADRLGIHLNTLDAHVKRGTIRAVKLGRRTLIPEGELERLLGTAK
jgi:excisionase family DNA binding protein